LCTAASITCTSGTSATTTAVSKIASYLSR
jgi:hypothetical protein